MDWNKIEEITREANQEVLSFLDVSSVRDIAAGYCAFWAKSVYNALKDAGIESEIVVNDVFELEDELEGYEVIDADYCEREFSHCYIKVNGWFFDAFDVEGVEREDEMSYFQEMYNY